MEILLCGRFFGVVRRFFFFVLFFPGVRNFKEPDAEVGISFGLQCLGYQLKTYIAVAFRAAWKNLSGEQGDLMAYAMLRMEHAVDSGDWNRFARSEVWQW